MPQISEITADTLDYMRLHGCDLIATFDNEAHYRSQEWIFDLEDSAHLVATAGDKFRIWLLPA